MMMSVRATDARFPVEKIAMLMPSTLMSMAATNSATDHVLPKRRGVMINTSWMGRSSLKRFRTRGALTCQSRP